MLKIILQTGNNQPYYSFPTPKVPAHPSPEPSVPPSKENMPFVDESYGGKMNFITY